MQCSSSMSPRRRLSRPSYVCLPMTCLQKYQLVLWWAPLAGVWGGISFLGCHLMKEEEELTRWTAVTTTVNSRGGMSVHMVSSLSTLTQSWTQTMGMASTKAVRHMRSRQSLKDKLTGQPEWDHLTLRHFFQMIPDCTKLTVKTVCSFFIWAVFSEFS